MQPSRFSVPYCPVEDDGAFEQQLTLQCGFTLLRHTSPITDKAVIRPRWHITPTGKVYNHQTFFTFFDDRLFRTLLHCMLNQAVWEHNDLLQQIGSSLTQQQQAQIQMYLEYGQDQTFFEQQGNCWRRGPQLQQVTNLGPTFEWVVMEDLRTYHHALVRRDVQLHEMSTQGDLDVVALQDNWSMMIECKSSTRTIHLNHLRLFLQRAAEFHADIALLLMDTANEDVLHMRLQHLQQMYQKLGQKNQRKRQERQQPLQGVKNVSRIANNLYIANTSEGIRVALEATIQRELARKVRASSIVV